VARKRGVSNEAMLAGAKRYAGKRAGQDPKYTKHPATWLNAGCYADEPPDGGGGPPVIDQFGNVIPMPSMRPANRNQPDTWADVNKRVRAKLGMCDGQ
jgi:hypothetical protein